MHLRSLDVLTVAGFVFGVSAPASAAVLPHAKIVQALASARALRPSKTYADDVMHLPAYELEGTKVQGYVNEDVIDYGYLNDGVDVLIVPLVSGGSGGVFDTLLFTSIGSTPHFIGYVPSPSGHLDVHIDEGQLVVTTPIYGPNDPDCCWRKEHVIRYTIEGGKLKQLRAYDQNV